VPETMRIKALNWKLIYFIVNCFKWAGNRTSYLVDLLSQWTRLAAIGDYGYSSYSHLKPGMPRDKTNNSSMRGQMV